MVNLIWIYECHWTIKRLQYGVTILGGIKLGINLFICFIVLHGSMFSFFSNINLPVWFLFYRRKLIWSILRFFRKSKLFNLYIINISNLSFILDYTHLQNFVYLTFLEHFCKNDLFLKYVSIWHNSLLCVIKVRPCLATG